MHSFIPSLTIETSEIPATTFDDDWSLSHEPGLLVNEDERTVAARPPEGAAAQRRETEDWAMEHDDHVAGEPNAPVMLLEYGNYLSPESARLHGVIDGVKRRYDRGDLRHVFRFVPMPEEYPAAQLAAEAAEAAAARGKFWEMHRRLMEAQHLFAPGFLTWHAAAIGLNFAAFVREMNLRIHAHRATRHAAAAERAGLHRHPSLFVNGRRMKPNADAGSVCRAIDEMLVEA